MIEETSKTLLVKKTRNMNPVVHFELPYKDAKRITAFYKNVFAWQLHDLGEESGNYILATTAINDVKPGFPAGSINGGLYPIKPDWPMQYPSIVIGIENIDFNSEFWFICFFY